MSYFEECLEKFNSLPVDFREQIGGFAATQKIEELEDVYKIDLKFPVILVAIGELQVDDVPEYLQKKYGLDEETTGDILNDLLVKVFSILWPKPSPLVLEMEKQIKNTKPLFSTAVEVKETFIKGLVEIFNDQSGLAEEMNRALFTLLANNGLLQEELAKLLYENQEVLTTAIFVVEDKNQSATISNWIKDFIRENGSNIFDNLALTKFLTSSLNAKILNPEERRIVDHLLRLYRNLSFFPESMKGIPEDNWEFFPIERRTARIELPAKSMLAINQEMIPEPMKVVAPILEKKPAEPLRPAVLDMGTTSTPPTLSPEIKKLQEMLKQYSANSLEGKAIAAELKRLRIK